MDTTSCELENLHRIEIPLSLLSDLARSLVHLVRGHLSVVSNDLEYFGTVLPSEGDGTPATARSVRRISETVEILEILSTLSFAETKENSDKLLLRFFSILGIANEEHIRQTSKSAEHSMYVISKQFPELVECTFDSVADLAKKCVGEKGVLVAAVIDLLLSAQGVSVRASCASNTAALELELSRSRGAEI